MRRDELPGLTRCYDLLAMLEAEVRTTKQLRQLLQDQGTTADNGRLLRQLCDELLNNAVETARTCADLRDDVCGSGSEYTQGLHGRGKA